ncbi:DUF551 domain-containing protein [Enterobacter hormaechei subsp. hormaechei]|nr:DUF551 domain-containing protein [Enterobacter hormaechei subsp. hormaechei]
MTFTKERLTELSRRENVGAILGEEIAELARIALASLEAEPVCVIDQSNLDYLKSGSDADVWPASRTEMGDVLLYRAAPPAPVSVPEWTNEQCLEFLSIAFRHAEIKGDLELDDIRLGVKMVNGSRAAMLQGAEPVTTAYKLPDEFDFDRFNDVVWLEAVASNPHMHSPTTSTIAMVALELNRKLSDRNSPVIPDGWVACSEQMPEDEQEVIVQNKMGYRYVSYFDEHSGLFFDMRGGNQMNCIEHIFVTHWMPMPAAPQQEVK